MEVTRSMNAAILLIPFILIRYVLLGLLDPNALKRAAHFPEMLGTERIFYWGYQLSSLLLLLSPFFLKVNGSSYWFYPGLVIYGLGVFVCAAAMIHFSRPQEDGFNQKGLYRFSRNPMYVGYFIYFLGCGLLTASWLFLAVLVIFQVSTHWLIRAEERWCLKEFGDRYQSYMKKVRRYI
jgi:protein-S-isoprenylcysteine O-methyltransferase Ste14